MKYALLVSRTLENGTVNGYKNMGDYIQSLAAAQFMPRIDEYYDKTSDDTGTEQIKMIMNAWYIWEPEKFPTSSRIVPLPISMHISPVCSEKLLSLEKVLNWFKKNEPIGCRDKATVKLLKDKGIDAYFSGCLTLTLGKKYKSSEEKKGLIFVDPYLPSPLKELRIFDCLKVFFFAGAHFCSYIKLLKRFEHSCLIGRAKTIKQIIYSAIFLKIYSKVFSLSDLLNANYFSHVIKVGEGSDLNTEEEKLFYAESLLKKYADSELVVTSRIHCALPCLGIETPVLFTTGEGIEEKSPKESAGRFEGLLEFFNIMRIKRLYIKNKINFPLKNKSNYLLYANELTQKCQEFMSETSGGAIV